MDLKTSNHDSYNSIFFFLIYTSACLKSQFVFLNVHKEGHELKVTFRFYLILTIVWDFNKYKISQNLYLSSNSNWALNWLLIELANND